MYDLLLAGATIVDPANALHAVRDLAIADRQIAALGPELPRAAAKRVIDLSGTYALPGLIDSHVHLSAPPFGGSPGHRMLARAGVTCALDMAGEAESLLDGIRHAGAGLTVGYVHPLIPGDTITGSSPSSGEIEASRDRMLERGALGLKLLGGHYPLTPDATALAINVCDASACYLAVHAGTTTAGSNVEGLEQLVELADGRALHVAHVNSYVRGQVTGDPIEEASRAIKALARAPACFSESYLSPINGAVATCAGGVATSEVVRTCLKAGGFPITIAGFEAAITAGWAQIHVTADGETRLADPIEGLAHWKASQTRTGVSFAVNPPGAALAVALAKIDGRFVIGALSTDGGSIPRNTLIAQGLPLVKAGALSLEEFVTKTSVAPARWLGLARKGHLGAGADADVTVVDLASGTPVLAVARGRVILENGRVCGSEGALFTTSAGAGFLRRRHVAFDVVDRAAGSRSSGARNAVALG